MHASRHRQAHAHVQASEREFAVVCGHIHVSVQSSRSARRVGEMRTNKGSDAHEHSTAQHEQGLGFRVSGMSTKHSTTRAGFRVSALGHVHRTAQAEQGLGFRV